MSDLFFHLPFARRLRRAEGLHPLIGEALTRRGDLVALGAALTHLPGNERKGMSWLRRLFSRGGESARWQKLLGVSGDPRVDLIASFLAQGEGEGGLGPLSRLALGLGFLSHEIVEATVGRTLGDAQGGERAALERAQARAWLQLAVPNARDLEAEWKGILDLGRIEQQKRALDHIQLGLKRVHGSGPGTDAIVRWTKGLMLEIEPLAAKAALPPALDSSNMSEAARQALVEQSQAATLWFVSLANRLGDLFTRSTPDRPTLLAALSDGGRLRAAGPADDAAKWRPWQIATRDATLLRGRNPKPAFALDAAEKATPTQRASFTQVVNLADLPAEVRAMGVPQSVTDHAPPQPAYDPPPMTQEVSLGQIESGGYAPPPPPAMTQEVSMADIEAARAAIAPPPPPAMTQEVSLADVQAVAAALPRMPDVGAMSHAPANMPPVPAASMPPAPAAAPAPAAHGVLDPPRE
jgi:hypothetical protein